MNFLRKIVLDKLSLVQNRPMVRINQSHLDRIIGQHVPALIGKTAIPGYQFRLFTEATTHPSATGRGNNSYERLEYLGDAVYHWAITVYLCDRFMDRGRDFLSQTRIYLEKGSTMTTICHALGLSDTLQCRVAREDSIYEDILEAFVGAFFTVYGHEHSLVLVTSLVETYINMTEVIMDGGNYKNLLIRYAHRKFRGEVYYTTRSSSGGYRSKVYRKGEDSLLGRGKGKTEKEAEQAAAYSALEKQGIIVEGQIRYGWEDEIETKEDEEDQVTVTLPHNRENVKLTVPLVRGLLRAGGVRVTGSLALSNFQRSMVHVSYTKKRSYTREELASVKGIMALQAESNEKLQLLGDSVIRLLVSDMLYQKYPKSRESFLTTLRSRMEKKDSVADLAHCIGIVPYVCISQYLEANRGRENSRIISGALKAWVGALYVGYGMDTTRGYYLTLLEKHLDIEQLVNEDTNYRAVVKDLCIQQGWSRPKFRLLSCTGPDHSHVYTSGLFVDGKKLASGTSVTVKKSEHEACRKLIEKIKSME